MSMSMNWIGRLALVVCFCCVQATLRAVAAESNLPVRQPPTPSTATLQQLSSSLVAISRQVEPAVVQIYELGNLMLHGQTRPIDLRVVNTQLHYRRTAVLQQTEFGSSQSLLAEVRSK
jgi:hypothetical protein